MHITYLVAYQIESLIASQIMWLPKYLKPIQSNFYKEGTIPFVGKF